MKKILITGGNGMVGKNLIYSLNKKKYKLFYPKKTELDLLKVRDIDNYIKKNSPNIIIHCAGLVGGIQANINSPFSFLYNNTIMGMNLVNISIKHNIEKFINLGSSCMYPKDHNGELNETNILSGKLEPTNEGYALAKISVAKLCEYAKKEHGFDYKTLIPCNLYGKYDNFDSVNSHMIPAVLKKIHSSKKNNKNVVIWGDGNARREFMYVEDLIDFIVFVLNNYDKVDSLMNVGLGYDFTINEYYKKAAKIIGFSGDFEYDLTRPVGMDRKLCSIDKQVKLDWSPSHTLDQGLLKTYKYYLKNYEI